MKRGRNEEDDAMDATESSKVLCAFVPEDSGAGLQEMGNFGPGEESVQYSDWLLFK